MSATMRAIRIAKFGPPEVLRVQAVDIPNASKSKVLVKIQTAGVNPVDTYIREGAFVRLPDLPFTPGKDGAGIVKSVGESVSKFKGGERVFVCGRTLGEYGTYAEYSVVDEVDVFPLDDRLNFDQGASLGIPYFTAYRALMLKAKCQKGETVLIHGASGAVGLAAVQIAKAKHFQVIGTAGTEEGMDLVKQNGADYVVCHREKDYLEKIMTITENKGVNVIIEMLSNVNLANDLNILAERGRVMVVGSRGPIKIDPRSMMGPETSVTGVALLNSTNDEWKEISSGILEGIREGWVTPVINKKYSLEDAPAAHEYIIHSPGAKGKILLSLEEN